MIEYIEIHGERYPFLFSIRAAREVDEAGDIGDISLALMMGWLGLKYGHLGDKKEMDFTQEDYELWVDVDPSILSKITEVVKRQSKKVGDLSGNPIAPKA